MSAPRIEQIRDLRTTLDTKLEGVVSLGTSADGNRLYALTEDRVAKFRRIKSALGINITEFDNYLEISANIGNSANKIVALDGSARLPAVNASQLTNLNVANLVGSKQLSLALIDLPLNNFLIGDNSGSPARVLKSNIPLSGFGLPTANIAVGDYKITTTAGAFALNELVSRAYVDAVAQGVSPRAPVRVATTSNINIASPGFQIDGINMINGDRVLLKEQADAAENGVWVWNGQIVPMTRSLDTDTEGELANMEVFVQDGTYAGQKWRLETAPPIQVGVTELVYFQTYASLDYSAGAGLSISGRTFSVAVDNVTTAVHATKLVVRSSTVAGQVLKSTGVAGEPAEWGAVDLSNVNASTGYLPFARGGTGLGAISQHTLLGAITAGNAIQAVSIPTNAVAGRLSGNVMGLNRAQLKELLGLRRGVVSTNCVSGNMMLAEILVAAPSDLNSVMVFLNGQLLRLTTDYTIDVNSKVWGTNALNEQLGGTAADGLGFASTHWVLVIFDY